MSVQCRAVVPQRRGLALPVLVDEPQPLRCRVGERRPAAHHPGQRAATRLVEKIAESVLSRALREPARGWTATLRPRRPDLLLDLPAVRQPVLPVPDGPARTVDAEDV